MITLYLIPYTYKLLNQTVPPHFESQLQFIDDYIELYNRDYLKNGYVYCK